MKAPELLKTKLLVPRVRHELVERPRLIELLNAGLSSPLTLISAPAGSGKTTILSDWVRQLAIPAAWISLDENDNDLARFFLYLITALQMALPGVGQGALDAFRSPEGPPVEPILTSLINEISEETTDFALVLDDYHIIRSQSIQQAISFLIEHLPSQMHLIIASRIDPNLPLARLRARNRMQELRSGQLRFTASETADFLNRVNELDLAEGDISTLLARTEGWVVGLQMAALSLKGRSDAKAFIQDFSGSNRYLLDYLVEEILCLQPAHIQTFLLQTCILDRLCGPLCEAVVRDKGIGDQVENAQLLSPDPLSALPFTDSQQTLEHLERANLFIIPLDEARKWYRYHHLFADLLRAKLAQTKEQGWIKTLHTRAAGWYEANGFFEEAIHHRLAAQETRQAARLIESLAEKTWLNGEYAKLMRWITALPEELVLSRPWLCVWNAWSLTQTGPLQGAGAWIDAAERAIDRYLSDSSGDESIDVQALRDAIATLRVFTASLDHDHERAILLAEQVLSLDAHHPADSNLETLADRPSLSAPAGKSSLIARCHILHGLSSLYYVAGEFGKAEHTCRQTIAIAREIRFLLREIHAINKLAYIYRITGQLHRTHQHLQENLARILQSNGKYFAVSALYCRLGDLFYEWNRLEEAQHLIEDNLRLNALGEAPYLLVDSYNVLSRLCLARQDFAGAQAAFDKATSLLQQSYIWPALIWPNESIQVRLWLKYGDLSSAASWAHEHKYSGSGPIPFSSEVREINRVRVLLAQGLWDAAAQTTGRLAASAMTGGRTGSLVEIWALAALAFQGWGKSKEAVTALETALVLAEPEGYVRTFIDEGSSMRLMIEDFRLQIEQKPDARRFAGYLDQLLSLFQLPLEGPKLQSKIPDQKSEMLDRLTEREVEVLRWMAAGLSNGEIAQQLVIAMSTVKRHVNHIFGKLGVTTRTQALVKARELRIL